MAARQFIERVFNRGLNTLAPRVLLKRGQSSSLINVELEEFSVKRRRGKKAAYQPNRTAGGSPGTLRPVSMLKRFYHLSAGGVLKRIIMAYNDRIYTPTSDWSDDTGTVAPDEDMLRLYTPNSGSSSPWDTAPTLPDEFGTSSVGYTEDFIIGAEQSRQWLYIWSDYASGDNNNELKNIPIRTACGVSPTVGNDYEYNSFSHGLYEPLALLPIDTEHDPIPDSSQWNSELSLATTVADGVGGSQCMVLDSAGNPHILFVDDATDDLFIANRAADGTWSNVEVIDAITCSQNVGAMSIAKDSDGGFHVAVCDTAGSGGGDLYYAYSEDSGATWTSEAVDSGNNLGHYNSVIVNSNGKPGIVYYDTATADLWYLEQTGDGTWEGPGAAIDATSADVGLHVSATVDSTGKIHAVYVDTTNHQPRYITRDAGAVSDASWNSSATLTGAFNWYGPTAIAIDSDDNVGAIFAKESGGNYTPTLWINDGSWSSTAAPDTDTAAPSVALAFDLLDDSNVAHMFYLFNTGPSDPIYYANNKSGTVSSGSFPGAFTSTDRKLMGAKALTNNLVVATTGAGSGSASGEWFFSGRSSYYYKITAEYDDGKLGESGPSSATYISYDGDVDANNTNTISLLNSDTADYYRMARDVTKMYVYRTVKGDSSNGVYYRVGSVTCSYSSPNYAIDSDFTDNVPDSDLVSNVILDEDVYMPPKYKTACFWKDRMVIGHLKARDMSATAGTELDLENGGYHPNRIRFSRAGLPDVFPGLFFIDVDIGGESATVRRVIVNKKLDALMVFLEDNVVIIPDVVS